MSDRTQSKWLDPSWFDAPALRPQRWPSFELLAVAVLFLWNLTVNLVVPDVAAYAVVSSGALLLLLIAHRSGADWKRLGLAPAALRDGVRYGLVIVFIVAAAILLAALVPASRSALGDDRFLGIATGEMLVEVLVRIPLVTALGEEIAFRAVLLGLLLAWYSPFRAAVLSSALFGLWHVLPGVDALETTTVTQAATGFMGVVSVAGQVIVTGFAGMGFAWLRLRSGSLAAPVLAHWGLNATAYFAGWLIVRNSWA
ncbi:MAG: type II CAAX endopeptidase family protein [Acidimicrobiia bacterium]|nr:type II CAAX endopeptidase family protein [Acidimicrobiia bacterium]